MSGYRPKMGDRVRVTQVFEGTVDTRHTFFEVTTDDGGQHLFDWDDVAGTDALAYHFEKLCAPCADAEDEDRSAL